MKVRRVVSVIALSFALGCSDDHTTMGDVILADPVNSGEITNYISNRRLQQKHAFLKNMQLGIGLEEVEAYLQSHIKDYHVDIQKHSIKFHWFDEEGVAHFLRTNNDSVLRELTYTIHFEKKHPSFLTEAHFRALREMIKEDYGQPITNEKDKSDDLFWQNYLEMNVHLVVIQDTIYLKKSVGEELLDES